MYRSCKANGYVAVLVIAVLLACHGVLGAQHQASHQGSHTPAPVVASAVEHAGTQHPAAETLQQKDDAPGAVSYAGVLLALSLGAAALLLAGTGGRLKSIRLNPVVTRAVRRTYPHPPRGPTLASLQVYRL